jgi:tRNA-binding EMAP/Myf-like protein
MPADFLVFKKIIEEFLNMSATRDEGLEANRLEQRHTMWSVSGGMVLHQEEKEKGKGKGRRKD